MAQPFQELVSPSIPSIEAAQPAEIQTVASQVHSAPIGQQTDEASTADAQEQQAALPIEPSDPTSNPHNHAALQVDENDLETDSAYGSSVASTSASLASSITNYLYENGRRYHAYKEGEYYLPNDEVEQDRLDLQHHIYRLCLGGPLWIAPIKDPQSILDIGTGTGIWATELADEFPDAVVIGTDLSPIQPDFCPPNLKFYVDDFEGRWDFPEVGKFDFIHWRSLSGSTGDFATLYAQAFRELKPGAYLEVHEYDADIYSDDDPNLEKAPWTRSWCVTLQQASMTFGKPLNVGRFHKQWMEEAGFEDVREKVVKTRSYATFLAPQIGVLIQISRGPWTKDPSLKELGHFELCHMNQSVEAHSMALYTRVLGHSVEEAKVVFEMVRKEFNDSSLHMYTVYRFVHGRKPEGA